MKSSKITSIVLASTLPLNGVVVGVSAEEVNKVSTGTDEVHANSVQPSDFSSRIPDELKPETDDSTEDKAETNSEVVTPEEIETLGGSETEDADSEEVSSETDNNSDVIDTVVIENSNQVGSDIDNSFDDAEVDTSDDINTDIEDKFEDEFEDVDIADDNIEDEEELDADLISNATTSAMVTLDLLEEGIPDLSEYFNLIDHNTWTSSWTELTLTEKGNRNKFT